MFFVSTLVNKALRVGRGNENESLLVGLSACLSLLMIPCVFIGMKSSVWKHELWLCSWFLVFLYLCLFCSDILFQLTLRSPCLPLEHHLHVAFHHGWLLCVLLICILAKISYFFHQYALVAKWSKRKQIGDILATAVAQLIFKTFPARSALAWEASSWTWRRTWWWRLDCWSRTFPALSPSWRMLRTMLMICRDKRKDLTGTLVWMSSALVVKTVVKKINAHNTCLQKQAIQCNQSCCGRCSEGSECVQEHWRCCDGGWRSSTWRLCHRWRNHWWCEKPFPFFSFHRTKADLLP